MDQLCEAVDQTHSAFYYYWVSQVPMGMRSLLLTPTTVDDEPMGR